MKESAKRVIDWLTFIPLGFWPATLVWSHYTHYDHPSAIWIVLLAVNLPLVCASLIWLGLRVEKVKILRWWYYNIAVFPLQRLLFILGFVAIVLFIQWLWR